ncbi:MAG: DUF2905 domain-containing protein [Nitrospirota bacterium]|nr:DUF2905 domain-containing protein [Nitrospirota bacterium]MDE3034824.1 DUF2905 domain-containing protein [Nitrospirota bacterium]MDE3119198.1 DUF2905 domain-containing protein [Nitrospirota bacterium]MDE3225153.1 DUF2905 domain-containing protein [Nitrospirota bacterium]MDE3242527.1 DUF2905 domain-containing protein [Nitrospirota bacterium]
MQDWSSLGKVLLVWGGLLALIGALLMAAGKWSAEDSPGWLSWFGKLPGDILIKREHVTFYFPLATSLLISVVVTLLLYLFSKR